MRKEDCEIIPECETRFKEVKEGKMRVTDNEVWMPV